MHTPGPWTTKEMMELQTGGERRPATYISASWGWAAPRRTIAIVGHWRDRPNPQDDARLIAAAPELLAACKKTAAIVIDGYDAGNTELNDAWDACVEAIARATNEN